MATAPKQNVPAKKETPTVVSIVDIVAEKVNAFIQSGELHLPKDYSVPNALKSAYLILNNVVDKDNKPALEVCSRASVANAVLDMIVQGLNPGKKQVYFIVYGKTLVAQRSYFGSMAVAEMVNPAIRDWGYNVVYEGDTFKYGIHNGKASVIEHSQDIDNVDKANIKAAYAMALDKEGVPIKTEIMTIDEIKQAWKMSKMNPIDDQGNVKASSTHGKFSRDMALKTVINKVAKFIINASSDNALLLERINRNEDLADAAGVQVAIEERANTGSVIMIEDEPKKIEGETPKEEKTQEAGTPSPEEEKAMLEKRGMVSDLNKKENGKQARQPGF
jgi:recombination protein RecT